MTLVPIKIKPGIDTETPSLTSDPAWRKADKIRFKAGQPEKIGGWIRDAGTGLNSITGVARSIHTWKLLNGIIVTAIGTTEKLYLFNQSTLYDITPIRATTTYLGNDALATVSGSTTVTVTDTAHGSNNGDYVTLSGAVCSSLTDSEVNANHKITYVDTNTYTITVTTSASSTTNTGGGVIVGAYEIPVGSVSNIANYGYGAGAYGDETYDTERTIASLQLKLRYWSLVHFGEDLIASHEGGAMYTWVYDGDYITRATVISAAPAISDYILVSSPDRHLISFASSTDTAPTVQNTMLVRWANQETKDTWTSTAENTAGDHILAGGSEIMTAHSTQNATLIWTDVGVHAMQYIGAPFTFGFSDLAVNCGAISKSCVISKDAVVYWMGKADFYIYDGIVKVLPCTIHRDVFGSLNLDQKSKVIAGLIREFDEVIWFYPSSTGEENDKYIIFNYAQQIWYNGTIVRTAWVDSELNDYPVGITDTGTIYHHENGVDDDTSAMTSYIETAEFDLQEGDKFYSVRRAIPDMTIVAGDVDYIFKTRRYPHATQVTDTTKTVSASTERLDLRIRSRQLTVRVESNALSDCWRMGTLRLDLRSSGRQG